MKRAIPLTIPLLLHLSSSHALNATTAQPDTTVTRQEIQQNSYPPDPGAAAVILDHRVTTHYQYQTDFRQYTTHRLKMMVYYPKQYPLLHQYRNSVTSKNKETITLVPKKQTPPAATTNPKRNQSPQPTKKMNTNKTTAKIAARLSLPLITSACSFQAAQTEKTEKVSI